MMRDRPMTYRTRKDLLPSRNLVSYMVVGAGALIAVLLIGGVMMAVTGHTRREVVETTVNDKERVCESSTDGSRECYYLVFTDAGTYRVTDDLLLGRFNSSDLYGRIKRGKRYRIELKGYRIPILSEYQNIVTAEELPS